MKLEELTTEDKMILRAILELTLDVKVIQKMLQSGKYNGLSGITAAQIGVLIGDLIDFDSVFDGGGLDDLDDLGYELEGWDL